MYAGVDLGATRTRAIVADSDGVVAGRDDRATPDGPTGAAVTETVRETLRVACGDAGAEPTDIRAVGVGAFGPFNRDREGIVSPANFPAAVDTIPLAEPVGRLVGSDRVFLHRDATAGVIGERFHGDDAPEDLVYLTISTGIGAGICLNGTVVDGRRGNAGEVGHLTLDSAEAVECGCGSPGHWEAYCSGTGIPRYARHLAADTTLATNLPLDGDSFAADDVFAVAGEDPLADHVLDRVARWNALGVADLVHAYAPSEIRIGGAVAVNNPSLVLDPVRDRLPALVLADAPTISLTALGDEVVLHGALASAMTDGTGDPSDRNRG